VKLFKTLAIDDPGRLVFGRAAHPLKTRRGLTIGGGLVHPELNFTLPVMEISASTFPEIRRIYHDVAEDACRRALELECEGFVVELEFLIEMTQNPAWCGELTAIVDEVLESHFAARGLKSAVRATPNDLRELVRPPLMRSGEHFENMLRAFESCAEQGAELLSVESTGGKEVHDEALLNADTASVVFALGVLGYRDMTFLWARIKDVASRLGVTPAGDTACGFGNTAMVLAEKGFIPKVFAAVVRAMSAVRSLAAYEQGAAGPGKDCAYENVVLKALTGFPMSMEGKTAACAHSSPVGNIMAAACDLWSNESVQNVKLLGGMAPTVSLEQLIYDCRLMNTAARKGQAEVLQGMFVDSDYGRDPQSVVLAPRNAIRLAKVIAAADGPYRATRDAGLEAVAILRQAEPEFPGLIPAREKPWLDRVEKALASLPDNEDDFIAQHISVIEKGKFLPKEYGLN